MADRTVSELEAVTPADDDKMYISQATGGPPADKAVTLGDMKTYIASAVTGYTGSAGAGYTGSAGGSGYTGSQGVAGAGYTGSQGVVGYTGSLGSLGYTGSQGAGLSSLTEVDDGNSGSTKTINFSTAVNHKVTMTAACTFTFTAPTAGEVIILKMIQDGTGGWTVVWPGTVNWGADGEPAWDTLLALTNIAVFYYDGAEYWGKALTIGAA
jgi:hypothetical protein